MFTVDEYYAKELRKAADKAVLKAKLAQIQADVACKQAGDDLAQSDLDRMSNFLVETLSEVIRTAPLGQTSDDPSECMIARVVLAREIALSL